MQDLSLTWILKLSLQGLGQEKKLFEELFHASKHLLPTHNPSILLGAPRTMDHGFLSRALHELETVAKDQDNESILRLLHALVPEYKEPKTVKTVYSGLFLNDLQFRRSS